MFADEYVCGQYCDKASILTTPQRFASKVYPTGGAGVDRLWRFILTGCFAITQAVKRANIRCYHPLPSSALICDKEAVSVETDFEF